MTPTFHPADSPADPSIDIVYIGGPTTTVTVAGVTFITDPTFDAGGTKYPLGAVTLTKLVGPAKSPADLGRLDVALISHDQHPDNLDRAGRELLANIPKVLTTVAGARRLESGAVGLEPWQSFTLPTNNGITLRVTATPARHGPVGIERMMGDVIGFVISVVETNRDCVYITGDTVWYEGTADVARRFRPSVVLLFGGAARSRGPFFLTMNTNDAVEAAVAFKDAALVPVHHEGWAHFTESQDDLASTFATLGLENRLHRVEAGRVLRFPLR